MTTISSVEKHTSDLYCFHCQKNYKNKKALWNHRSYMHGGTRAMAATTSAGDAEANENGFIADKDGHFSCTECEKRYRYKKSLQTHYVVEHQHQKSAHIADGTTEDDDNNSNGNGNGNKCVNNDNSNNNNNDDDVNDKVGIVAPSLIELAEFATSAATTVTIARPLMSSPNNAQTESRNVNEKRNVPVTVPASATPSRVSKHQTLTFKAADTVQERDANLVASKQYAQQLFDAKVLLLSLCEPQDSLQTLENKIDAKLDDACYLIGRATMGFEGNVAKRARLN